MNDAELANAILLGTAIAEQAQKHKGDRQWARLSEIKMRLEAAGFEQPEVWIDYVLKRVLTMNQYTELQRSEAER